jgi:TM2 domain-containing membrane protein YozV
MFRSKPTFTEHQFDRLSNIADNASQVVLGVVVLSPLIAGVDKVNMLVVLSGLLTVIMCWVGSMWFAKKGE